MHELPNHKQIEAYQILLNIINYGLGYVSVSNDMESISYISDMIETNLEHYLKGEFDKVQLNTK